jgi:dATP pyrophosphohydrolase
MLYALFSGHNERRELFAPFFIPHTLMSDSYKIPESVLVVIYRANLHVLLIERTGQAGFWQSVTGSKDTPDEGLIETAKREVWEETGIFVRDQTQPLLSENSVSAQHLSDWQVTNIYDIYPVWRHRYAPGVTKNTEHVFGLLVPDNIQITLSAREHTDYCWLPYKEAADRCFSPSNAEAILQLPHHC